MALVRQLARRGQRHVRAAAAPWQLLHAGPASRADEERREASGASAIRAFHSSPPRDSAILFAGLGVAGAALSAKYVVQVSPRSSVGYMFMV